jgi:Rrf2 family protein
MQFSAKAEYACLAMLELAVRHDDPRPVRLVDITDAHGIPQRFLVQILLQLKGAGLVRSTRGAAGGYHLGRSPEAISLADILDVVDRSESGQNGARPTTRTDGTASPMALALRDVWSSILKSRQAILEKTNLATLAQAGQGLQYVI